MNANNAQQLPMPPTSNTNTASATSSSVQIQMERPGIGTDPSGGGGGVAPHTTTTSTVSSSSMSTDSFGVLRGRLIDGIRRAILTPSTATNSPVSSSPATNGLAFASTRYQQQQQQPPSDSAHQLYLNLSSAVPTSAGAVNGPHGMSPAAVGHQSPNGYHHSHVMNSTSSPRTPEDPFFFHVSSSSHGNAPPAVASGGLRDEDLPQSQPHSPTTTAGGGGAYDENQRSAETFTDAMAQHPELRSFVVAVLKTLPFVGIVVLKLSYDHLHGLINLAFLAGIFLHTNLHLTREITKKQLKNTKKLAFHLVLIAFGLFIKWVDDSFVLDIVTMMSYRTLSTLSDLLYYLLMADLSIKCLTVGIKTTLTMLPEKVVEFKGRGRIYLLIESVSQFYRCFLPVQPWAAFLLNNYEGYDKIFGTILVVAYVFWKFQEVLNAGKFLRESYIKFRQNSNFGTTPTNEELHAVGSQCPICHESFSCPIALECGHIFCDLCIGVWFDRETTCPLCRKKITDDPRFRDGSTSLFVQLA